MWWWIIMTIVVVWLALGGGFVFGYSVGRSHMGAKNEEWEQEDREKFWLCVGFLIALGDLQIVERK